MLYVNPKPPMDIQSFKAWRSQARHDLVQDNSWRPDFVGLCLRVICAPSEIVQKGFVSLAQVFDIPSMTLLDPAKDPLLTQTMNFATTAGVASLLLYRRKPVLLNNSERDLQDWSRANYMSRIAGRAERHEVSATIDDVRFLALLSSYSAGAGVPHRDWSLLLKDDVRWCLAAREHEWFSLINDFPQTKTYLESLLVLCQLVSRKDALYKLWYESALQQTLALPNSLDM